MKGEAMLDCETAFQSSEDKWWRKSPSTKSSPLPQSSTFLMGVKDSIPSPQIWSRCEHCAMQIDEESNLEVILFDPSHHLIDSLGRPQTTNHHHNASLVVSSIKWRGFFHDKPELIRAKLEEEGVSYGSQVKQSSASGRDSLMSREKQVCDLVIKRPVFVFSILTWQVGHLLVDVLEPLYYTMMSQYGRVPTELGPILIFEVASQDEGTVFLEKLISTIHELDTPYRMLKYFTKKGTAFHTTNALRAFIKQKGRVCFSDLHAGLDVSTSYYVLGFERHPFGFDPTNHMGDDDRQGLELSYRYCQFRSWLWNKLGWNYEDVSLRRNTSEINVNLITRKSTRKLMNQDRVVVSLRQHFENMESSSVSVNTVSLEDMSFSEQISMFRNTTVLVAQYGSALHNTLFLHPGASVLIMMQPKWCDWAWGFASQASLLKLNVHVMCDEPDQSPHRHRSSSRLSRYRWHENSWWQGPWSTKDADYSVSIPTLQHLLGKVLPLNTKANGIFSDGGEGDKEEDQVALLHQFYHTSTFQSRDCDQSYYQKFFHDENKFNDVESYEGYDQIDDVFKFYADSYEVKQVSGGSLHARAHIANISVSAIVSPMIGAPPVTSYHVKMVPEIWIHGQGAKQFMQLHHQFLLLCSEVLDPTSNSAITSPTCHDMRTFNEFSTLDLTFSQHSLVVVHAWLVDTMACKDDDNNGDSCDGDQMLNRSETFFVVDSEQPHRMASNDFTCGSSEMSVDIVIDDIDHKLTVRLWEEGSLQEAVAQFCHDVKLNKFMCARIAATLISRVRPYLLVHELTLPPPQSRPTIQEPFVFLHHEKTAGSTLRRYIVNSAVREKAKFHVPCYSPIDGSGPHIHLLPEDEGSCMNFDLSQHSENEKSQLSVLAGHFQWGVWHDRISTSSHNPSSLLLTTTPRVFIMFRDPIKRSISLYYERLYPMINVMMNDVSAEDFHYYLTSFKGSSYSRWRDEGFLNSTCRMICGANIHKGKYPKDITPAQQQEALSLISLEVSLRRLSLSVVGLTDQWDSTKKVIQFWYPWIDVTSEEFRENYAKVAGMETRNTLRPDHLSLMDSLNSCDVYLYESAKNIFQKQLAVIKSL
jgi:hypothetical protein